MVALKWQRQLIAPGILRRRTVGAIQPCLEQWLDREWGEVSYRMTQVLTGHGCFGEYLCWIKKKCTARCHHCNGNVDSAQHTLAECPAWAGRCRALTHAVGADLSLPAVVVVMVGSEEAWRAFASFCEEVI